MQKEKALTWIQAAPGTCRESHQASHRGTYAALHAVLRAQPAQHYRLPLPADTYQALEDDRYREDVLGGTERSFARKGVSMYSARLGIAICLPSEAPYEHLGKVYLDVPTGRREMVIVAVP